MRIGELLTSVSVLIALLGFLYTWRKDRRLRTKEYADKVRAAAAMTLAKVDRCESLFLSFIHRIRPIFTEIEDMSAKTESKDACRDQFWKQMIAIRLSIYKQFSDEQIELAYAPLFVHQSEIYDLFKNVIEKAKQAEDEFFWNLMGECQKAILGLPDQMQTVSPVLANKLLDISTYYHKLYAQEFSSLLDEIRRFLRGIVTASDQQIVSRT
jgi:hypothetical protein